MSSLTIYYDYTCPYVYRATEWIMQLQQIRDSLPSISWRYFSLTQVNYRMRDEWKVWEAPLESAEWAAEDYSRGLRFFWAAEASRRQGDEAFSKFHIALLRAIHAQKREMNSSQELIDLAQEQGLDRAQFEQDLQQPSLLQRLGTDHASGVERRVFGVPTFVFPDAEPAYLKLSRVLDQHESLEFWQQFTTVVAHQPFVLEIKRPQ